MKTNYTISNYIIENNANSSLTIHYNRSVKDYYYIILYQVIAAPLLFFAFKLSFLTFKDFSFSENGYGTFLIFCFFILGLFAFGLYCLIVAIQYLMKATKNTFIIDPYKKSFIVKKNLFKKYTFHFSEIDHLILLKRNMIIETSVNNRTKKRPLCLIELKAVLKNNQTIKIHTFEGTHIVLLGLYTTRIRNRKLQITAKHISDLISKNIDLKYYFSETNEDE